MIRKQQREKLKEVLGYHYTDGVLKILKEKNVTSRSGRPYGSSMIRNVFNGLNENEDIENAIIELFIRTQEGIKETEEARNRILGIS
ncbi:MAG: hypothetical protein AAF611_04110 [Bacteroidota bacterium]